MTASAFSSDDSRVAPACPFLGLIANGSMLGAASFVSESYDTTMFRLRTLEETTSTNKEVKCAIEAGEPEGLAVRALRQVGGYGRQGRTWSSPKGGLYLSLLLRPQVDMAMLPTLSLVTSLAVRRALAAVVGRHEASNIMVKWPNDIVVTAAALSEPPSGKFYSKLCGISLEAYRDAVCIGIGVNVFQDEKCEPVAGKNTPAYLLNLGFTGSIEEVAQAVLSAFEPLYQAWQAEGFTPLFEEYQQHAALSGRFVRMINHSGDLVAEGRVESLDSWGRLLLRDSKGCLVPVVSGEAHLV